MPRRCSTPDRGYFDSVSTKLELSVVSLFSGGREKEHLPNKVVRYTASSATNSVRPQRRDKSLTEAQQKRLIRDLKKGEAITGLYQFTNLQEEYKDASHWVYQCILSDLSALPGYDQQLLSLFMFGEQWVRTHASWDSLIAWTAKENHNYLSALAILHHLGREDDFKILKREAYEYYIKENLSTHCLESINI